MSSEPILQVRPGWHVGIDVSGSQDRMDWDVAVEAGVAFCWVKASEGQDFLSRWAKPHATESARRGILTGLYHFATPDKGGADDPEREAHQFLRVIKEMGVTFTLRPVLDYERRWTRDRRANTEWILRFCNYLTKHSDGELRPLVYSGASLLRRRVNLVELRQRGIHVWAAAYPAGPTHERRRRNANRRGGPRLGNGNTWVCWQWTSRARPAFAGGRRIDVNAAPNLNILRA